MKPFLTIFLLIIANVFMTIAWYGHLKFKDFNLLTNAPLTIIILISWGIALLEYFFQVPANRLGHESNGGPFNLWQLKVLQEVLSLSVFSAFTILVFKNEPFKWNYAVGFGLLILAVFFIFKK